MIAVEGFTVCVTVYVWVEPHHLHANGTLCKRAWSQMLSPHLPHPPDPFPTLPGHRAHAE